MPVARYSPELSSGYELPRERFSPMPQSRLSTAYQHPPYAAKV